MEGRRHRSIANFFGGRRTPWCVVVTAPFRAHVRCLETAHTMSTALQAGEQRCPKSPLSRPNVRTVRACERDVIGASQLPREIKLSNNRLRISSAASSPVSIGRECAFVRVRDGRIVVGRSRAMCCGRQGGSQTIHKRSRSMNDRLWCSCVASERGRSQARARDEILCDWRNRRRAERPEVKVTCTSAVHE